MQDDVLSQLRDIHWPGPVSFWPPAFGYYMVLLVLVAISVIAWYLFGFRRVKRRLKKQLIKELLAIESDFLLHRNNGTLQAAVSSLLKRLAFFAGPPHLPRAASLDEITAVLLQILPEKESTLHLVELLKKERFQKDPAIDGEKLLMIARTQIKRCRI